MSLRIVQRPSPNFNERPAGCAIDMLVLHYTGMQSAEAALRVLTDGSGERRVSAHYTLDEDGTTYAHVDEGARAWHAGVSCWSGRGDVNARSIGIEIVNPGHEWGYPPFPEFQVAALIELCRGILERHPIPARNVVGHSDVAPGRKVDPGEKFPWRRLAGHGIGLWPQAGQAVVDGDEAAIAAALHTIGYGVPPEVNLPLKTVVREFQRHYRPENVDGVVDVDTRQLLAGMLRALDVEAG